MLQGEHRIDRRLLIAGGVLIFLFCGAYLFEKPRGEDVEAAFLKADPTLAPEDLQILERDPLTFRTVYTGGRNGNRQFEQEVDTTLWCARDRRRPDRRMALNFFHSKLPLVSGPRTVARSWVIGRGIVADNMLAECDRLAAEPSPSRGIRTDVNGPPFLPPPPGA